MFASMPFIAMTLRETKRFRALITYREITPNAIADTSLAHRSGTFQFDGRIGQMILAERLEFNFTDAIECHEI